MRWSPGGRSGNIEDRRGSGGFPGGGMGMGLGGTVVVLILSLLFGRNLFNTGTQTVSSGGEVPDSAAEEPAVQFVSFVLDDVQSTWAKVLPRYGAQYHDAKLVLYRGMTPTACGTGQSAAGPFYCPMDEKVYIDLEFFDELRSRFGAPGDFAQAYVIAHELGHHVQHLLGTDERVRQLQQARPGSANQLSVMLELQADCYAGVWGHSTQERQLLDPGDVDEGLRAAASVGDDRLQQASGRAVSPESFTHGSAAERASWLRRGLQTGDPASCDTFGGNVR